MTWYDALRKPGWTPAPATISTIWTILYPIIVVTFGYVFVRAFRRSWPRRVAVPFGVNLAANLLFMPCFAGLRSVPLATLDILVVWATIPWMMARVWPHAKWVALAQVPYFAWVSTATVIQVSIFAMNR